MEEAARELPVSTGALVLQRLRGPLDVPATISWAAELWALGWDCQILIDIACIAKDDWPGFDALAPDLIVLLGLDEPTTRDFLIERWLLSRYLNREMSSSDLIDAGYEVCRLLRDATDTAPNTFDLYDYLGDRVSYELGLGDDRQHPEDRLRPWLLDGLIEDGAFDRVGLTPPAA